MTKPIQRVRHLALLPALLLATTPAYTMPMLELHSSNSGIDPGSFSVSIIGTTIQTTETWINTGPGVISISGLDSNTSYRLERNITNGSTLQWDSLAFELLDPIGNSNDSGDPAPLPSHVPAGFSTSNDFDLLSFDQGGTIPRSSTIFATVIADELTDRRDFLDFIDGTLTAGATDTLLIVGLGDRLASGSNQPFLLFGLANELFSDDQDIPTPATGLLFVGGLMLIRRRKFLSIFMRCPQ